MKQHTFIKKIISLLKKSIMNRITLDGILANKLFLYSIIIVFLCLRFCNLNQDAPSMMISSICEEDEAYYSVEGINQYNVEHNRYIKGFEKSMIAPLLIYSKSITYICLNIFGNNFYGLRVPVVLISILFLLFLFKTFKLINPDYNSLNILLLFLLFSDFFVYIFSRYHNPQIYSMLCISIVIWQIAKYNFESINSLIFIGFVATFATLSVYIYNIFLPLGIGLFLLYLSCSLKKVKYVTAFSLGCLLAASFFYVTTIYLDCSLEQIVNILTSHGGGVIKHSNLGLSQSLLEIGKLVFGAILSLIYTNFFRHNLILLYLFITLLPIPIIYIKKYKSRIASVLIILIATQFTLLLFVNSHSFKKLIVLVPIVYVLILFSLVQLIKLRDDIFKKNKITFFIFSIIGFVCCLLNIKVNNSPVYWSGYSSLYNYYENIPSGLVVFNLLIIFIAFLLTLILLFMNVNYYKIITRFLILPIIFQTTMCCYFFIYKSTYFYRNTLLEMKPIIENKVLIGGFPHFHQFYTNCIPAMSCYVELNYYHEKKYNQIMDSLFDNKIAEYTIFKHVRNDTTPIPKEFDLIKVYQLKYFDNYLCKRRLMNKKD